MKLILTVFQQIGLLLINIRYQLFKVYVFGWNIGSYLRHPRLLWIDFFFFYFYHINYSQSRHTFEKSRINKDRVELTYGETSYYALRQALRWIKVPQNSVFYDLGCGRGKLVYYMNQVFGIRSVGIDLMPTYIKVAKQFAKSEKIQKVQFLEKDFLLSDLSDGTVFYIAGTCLNPQTVEHLVQKLESCRQMRYIISTSFPIEADSIRLMKTLRVPFSWGYGKIFVHQKVN